MYKKLTIKNFKCFVDNTFAMNKLTIFTGVNAAGKSSVIQSLLLFHAALKSENHALLDPREILGIDIGSPKNLISQNAEHLGEYDFSVQVDEELIKFCIDRETGLNMKTQRTGTGNAEEMTYLNTERIGPRSNYVAGGSERMKSDGSNAVYLMERANDMDIKVPSSLVLGDETTKFSYQVECWMSAIMGNVQLDSMVDLNKAVAELRIKNDFVDSPVNPTLTGFGISYELSVVVAALWMASHGGGTLIIENPEAHLHPSAQSAIGKFLAIVANTGVQVIVETHSEHVIDGARIQMYHTKQIDNMVINYLENSDGKALTKEITVGKDGELTDWPEGFFDQKQMDLRELFYLRRDNGDL